MDIYGMYDRLLEGAALALRWLDKNSPTEARKALEGVVSLDGSYVPRDLKAEIHGPPQEPTALTERLAHPLPAQPRDLSGMEAGTITITYPDGKHTFHRTGRDEWVLALESSEHDNMPSVTGYDNGNVLRVLASFLVGPQP